MKPTDKQQYERSDERQKTTTTTNFSFWPQWIHRLVSG